MTALATIDNNINDKFDIVTVCGLDSFSSAFLAFVDVSPASARTYVKSINSFLAFCSENAIAQPKRSDIVEYKNALATGGKSNTTITTYLAGLRRFFQFLEANHIYENITAHIKAPRVSKSHKKDCLTSDQARDVLHSFDRTTVTGRRDYAVTLLMMVCGLRTIEVARANIEDLRIQGGQQVLFIQGKGRADKSDFVRIPAPVEKAIRSSLADRSASESDPLFVSLSNNSSGRRLTTRSISGIAKDAFKRVNIDSDRVTAHSLRHTAVTLALLNGVALQEVQQFARHSSITTTQIYAHNLDQLQNPSESAICSALM